MATGFPTLPKAGLMRAPDDSAWASYLREISVAAAYVGILLVLAIFAPAFFSTGQWRDTWVQSAPALVAAVGMTLVIVAREIDISVGSIFSICGVVAGLAAQRGMPTILAAGIAILVGIGLGAINGGLVAFLGLPSIVVTLATMVIWGQGLKWINQGAAITGLPGDFQWFGHDQRTGEWILIGSAVVVWGAFAWGTRWLPAGRAVYAVGSDREAARLAGMRPRRVIFGVFTLMGALAALAAVLSAVRFPQVDSNAGMGLELQFIAAVVVGGTAISGGRGTMLGTLVGVVLLNTIAPALTFLHRNPQWEKAVQGLIILLAVAFDGLARRSRDEV